ncbi:MAG TPA: MATE family efflux transporter [Hellea balneolensis]|uniref:MATE family efflux transporter n=1 Tax=Hellea balneolensis TaxID=287478 RepID=A0A7C3C1X9_9PROT|nr:MATE family efflux transporter [Hellea balneolensis]
MSQTPVAPLTRTAVIAGAVPIMIANAATPIVGLVDTFVIGHYAGTIALAGIGLGAVIYGIFYWGFGFLRMSTAGLSAQADGAGRQHDVQAHLFRAVPLGFGIGVVLFALQLILLALLMPLYPAEAKVAAGARSYLMARFWGLPAILSSIALMGWFIGLARPRRALYMQIILNLVNIPLSILFVAQFGWGLFGVGIASAIAEWVGLIAGLILAAQEIKIRGGFDPRALKLNTLLDIPALKKLGAANSNLFIRTLSINFGFLFFAHAATKQGTVFLAGYHILMQFITMIALVLDSFANVAEAHVGAAYGAHNPHRFNRAVRLTTELSFGFAVLCALLVYVGGPFLIDALTQDPLVQASAGRYLFLCALAPLLGFSAWQMDGIFIGLTRTAAMRNASIAAVLIYLGLHMVLEPRFGGFGVWAAFLGYYIARAVCMVPAWPAILRDVRAPSVQT